jgi:FixJ family two-component response regulator
VVTSPLAVAVVEDDPSMRRSIERLLNAHGFATRSYESAEEFLGSDGADEAFCLLLDINLGGMSGIELSSLLKASSSPLPVIFITAMDDEELESRAVEAGCLAYLRKPFDAASLLGAINRAFPSY